MKDCWQNILDDNSIVISQEEMTDKAALLSAFERSFTFSNYDFVQWTHTKSAPYQCIITDGKVYIDVLLYLKNISNAGWDDKPHIKRVQVSNPKQINLEFNRFDDMRKISLIIGYYNYAKPIFVSWNADEFRRHRTNRSCYVEVENLLQGYKEGFCKLNFFSQDITLFTPENTGRFLDDFFHTVRDDLDNMADRLFDITMEYYKIISDFDTYWDGKDKILEMKSADYSNWKQSEWQGFYFEYLMEKAFGQKKLMKISFENTTFDIFDFIPWDLKVHTLNSNSKNKVITNDINAIKESISKFGYQGFIILEGEAEYEKDGEFRQWHDQIKGEKSAYQLQNDQLGKSHRTRKSAFKLSKLLCIVLKDTDLQKHVKFQEGFLNSNGKKRNPKLIIDLDTLNPKNILLKKELKD